MFAGPFQQPLGVFVSQSDQAFNRASPVMRWVFQQMLNTALRKGADFSSAFAADGMWNATTMQGLESALFVQGQVVFLGYKYAALGGTGVQRYPPVIVL
jgi:hypothetical protein